MGQRAFQQIVAIFLATVLPGCGDRETQKAVDSSARSPGIVSLVPAATGLLLGMNAGGHLLAVSNVDHDPRVASLPRVGDYLTTDWEQISQLHPQVIITQYGEGKTPEGFRQRAAALGIHQVNLHIERLEDVFAAITALGEAAQEAQAAQAAATRFHARLDAVKARVANQPPVPALIVTDDTGLSVAGPGTFLDELLTIAGGRNAAGSLSQRYAAIDRETLMSLAPQAIFQLLPGVSPQVAAQARATWSTLPELPAVKNHRVILLDQWYVELPSYELADLAESFAAGLHPGPATQPTIGAAPDLDVARAARPCVVVPHNIDSYSSRNDGAQRWFSWAWKTPSVRALIGSADRCRGQTAATGGAPVPRHRVPPRIEAHEPARNPGLPEARLARVENPCHVEDGPSQFRGWIS